MEAAKKRIIASGARFGHLFPPADAVTDTVMKNAGVDDTVALIPKVVHKTLHHTKGIAHALRGRNDYDTCRNIWHFVYKHIAYRRDRDGYEQIRSPARTWHDRISGVDCDCYTTFISSILTNLRIRHYLRITKYHRPHFQHIYPVAVIAGRKVILDCVTDKFDYEVPFSEKKDYPMDLQYLHGTEDVGYYDGSEGVGDLAGKKRKKLKIKVNLKKVLNIVNKFNPATVALRNGVLASLKLNIGNVAKRLRWSYMTEQQAKAKGVDFGRWQKLVKARQKLENIFYDAGGKPANFKKAILHGKGNKDHAVHGLEGLGSIFSRGHHLSPMHPHHPINRLHRHMPLRELLGEEMFYSENDMGMLGELGEPASMAMIAAASSVIAAIAGTLKKIGDIFGGKGKGAGDFNEEANAAAEKEIPESKDAAVTSLMPAEPDKTSSPAASSDYAQDRPSEKAVTIPSGSGESSSGGSGGGEGESADAPKSGSAKESSSGNEDNEDKGGKSGMEDKGGAGSKDDKGKKDFWKDNKKWIIPTGIGVAGIGIALAVAHSSKHAAAHAAAKPMHGTPKGGSRHKGKNHHRKAAKKTHHALQKVTYQG